VPDPAGDAVVPTLVVSDLHLGANSGIDLLREDGVARRRLFRAIEGVGRVVVAGDLLELRHAPPREILDRARPFLRALAERLGPDRELLLLPGNHDHRLIRPWLDAHRLEGRPLPLSTTLDPVRASPLAAALAEALAPARLRLAYPGAWIVPADADGRGGVLVMHGHYVDALWRMPTFERLSAGLAARTHGVGPDDLRTPDDFERVLAPGYGWMDGLADHASGLAVGATQRASSNTWERLNGDRGWTGRGLRLAVPRVLAALERAGLGAFERELTPERLRAAGLRGTDRVAAALGVAPAALIFGHTHRAGPLPGDPAWEWTTERGGRMLNTGAWVHPRTAPIGPEAGAGSAYWPGRAVLVDADGAAHPLRLLDDVADLRGLQD
jgi:hypothetical protein